MPTVTISLPDSLKDFLDRQVSKKGYGNVSEYFRTLLRDAQERERERNLQEGLLEGLNEGEDLTDRPVLKGPPSGSTAPDRTAEEAEETQVKRFVRSAARKDILGIGAPKFFANPKLAELRSWPVPGFEDVRVCYLEQHACCTGNAI